MTVSRPTGKANSAQTYIKSDAAGAPADAEISASGGLLVLGIQCFNTVDGILYTRSASGTWNANSTATGLATRRQGFASYIVWFDGVNYRADSLFGGTDYVKATALLAVQAAIDAITVGIVWVKAEVGTIGAPTLKTGVTIVQEEDSITTGITLWKISGGSGGNPGPHLTLKATTPEAGAGTSRSVIQAKDDQDKYAYSLEMGGADTRLKLYTWDGSTLRWRLGISQGPIATAVLQIADCNFNFIPTIAATTVIWTASLLQFLAPVAIQGTTFEVGPNGTPVDGTEASRSTFYGPDRGSADGEWLRINAFTHQDFRFVV